MIPNEKCSINLLKTTAILEILTGLSLVVLPSVIVSILLKSTLDTPISLVVARVAGVAIVALGIACWATSKENNNDTASGVVKAMTFYNVGVFIILVYAGTQLGLSGVGLWPVVVIHLVMLLWCLFSLWSRTSNKN